MIESIWSVLQDRQIIIFGKECGLAGIIMFCTLWIKSFLIWFHLDFYIPNGLTFALPFLIQVRVNSANIPFYFFVSSVTTMLFLFLFISTYRN